MLRIYAETLDRLRVRLNMYLVKRKKMEFILCNEIKCPKSGPFTNNIITAWGESGEVILQVSIAVFRALSKNFSGKEWLTPLQKIGPYAYATDYIIWLSGDDILIISRGYRKKKKKERKKTTASRLWSVAFSRSKKRDTSAFD